MVSGIRVPMFGSQAFSLNAALRAGAGGELSPDAVAFPDAEGVPV